MSDVSNYSSIMWQARMADLALSASCAEPGEAADFLRELHDLLRGANSPWAELHDFAGDAARFEALLAADACASAALLLIAGRAGYMVSQGTGGRVMATVTLGSGRAEVSSNGADLALALIGALAEAMAEAVGGADQDQRLARPSEVSLRLN